MIARVCAARISRDFSPILVPFRAPHRADGKFHERARYTIRRSHVERIPSQLPLVAVREGITTRTRARPTWIILRWLLLSEIGVPNFVFGAMLRWSHLTRAFPNLHRSVVVAAFARCVGALWICAHVAAQENRRATIWRGPEALDHFPFPHVTATPIEAAA